MKKSLAWAISLAAGLSCAASARQFHYTGVAGLPRGRAAAVPGRAAGGAAVAWRRPGRADPVFDNLLARTEFLKRLLTAYIVKDEAGGDSNVLDYYRLKEARDGDVALFIGEADRGLYRWSSRRFPFLPKASHPGLITIKPGAQSRLQFDALKEAFGWELKKAQDRIGYLRYYAYPCWCYYYYYAAGGLERLDSLASWGDKTRVRDQEGSHLPIVPEVPL